MIGKTRHPMRARKLSDSFPLPLHASQNCGDLISISRDWHQHVRFAPAAALTEWIEHFWLESWRVPPNVTEKRELLPHPCVQLAFSQDRARVYGVQKLRFIRTYEGEGRVFGIKFRAGAFLPFLRKSVSSLSNSSIAGEKVFSNAPEAASLICNGRNTAAMVHAATEFLTKNLPPPDSEARFIANIVATIMGNSKICKVSQLLSYFRISERSLQRAFQRYVGVSPRWVIKRYRAYEALDRLNSLQPQTLATVAQELGYFDQSHFANDFKRRVGRPPSEFLVDAARQKDRDSISS